MSASSRRSLLLACLPALAMAALLSRWFLFLLLMPVAALLYSRLLVSRHAAHRCLACGYNLDVTPPPRCPRCGVDLTPFGGNPVTEYRVPELLSSQVPSQPSPDEPFEWPANVELEAIVRTDVKLPGTILGNDEIFGSVIQISDSNAKITFEPGGDGSVFRSISIRLDPGVRLKLTKSTTAWLSGTGGVPGQEFYMRNVSQM